MARKTYKVKAEIEIVVDIDDENYEYYKDSIEKEGGVAELIARYVKAEVEESDYLLELAACDEHFNGSETVYDSLLTCKTEVIK